MGNARLGRTFLPGNESSFIESVMTRGIQIRAGKIRLGSGIFTCSILLEEEIIAQKAKADSPEAG